MTEMYIPSENEKAAGSWAVVCEKLLEDGTPDLASTKHIIPIAGRHHEIGISCWCGPTLETRDVADVCDCWVHHMVQ